MITCRTCGQAALPGTLFCAECGASLQDNFKEAALQSGLPWAIVHVLVPGSREQWRLNLNGPLWVGRADPDHGYWPQLDLTAANGAALGVSRRHAVIDVTDQGPVLIDKSSVNGTWIGAEQLVPLRPYVLPATAVVRFGRLQARIILE